MIGIDRIDDDDVWQQQILWLMGHLTTRIRNSCYNCCSSQKFKMAISQKLKELLKLRWWQNNQDFEGFSDLQKLDFWMKDFRISGFLEAVAISRKKESYQRSAGGKWAEVWELFRFSREKKIFFWFTISGYGGDISDIKRTTRDPLVAKWPNFPELFDFWIRWRYLGNEKSYRRFAGGKMTGISRAF